MRLIKLMVLDLIHLRKFLRLALFSIFIFLIYLVINLRSIVNLVPNVSSIRLIRSNYTVAKTTCDEINLTNEDKRNILEALEKKYIISLYPFVEYGRQKLPINSIEIILMNKQGDYAKLAIYNDGGISVIQNKSNYISFLIESKKVINIFEEYFD